VAFCVESTEAFLPLTGGVKKSVAAELETCVEAGEVVLGGLDPVTELALFNDGFAPAILSLAGESFGGAGGRLGWGALSGGAIMVEKAYLKLID
jgi:hypothetical protein